MEDIKLDEKDKKSFFIILPQYLRKIPKANDHFLYIQNILQKYDLNLITNDKNLGCSFIPAQQYIPYLTYHITRQFIYIGLESQYTENNIGLLGSFMAVVEDVVNNIYRINKYAFNLFDKDAGNALEKHNNGVEYVLKYLKNKIKTPMAHMSVNYLLKIHKPKKKWKMFDGHLLPPLRPVVNGTRNPSKCIDILIKGLWELSAQKLYLEYPFTTNFILMDTLDFIYLFEDKILNNINLDVSSITIITYDINKFFESVDDKLQSQALDFIYSNPRTEEKYHMFNNFLNINNNREYKRDNLLLVDQLKHLMHVANNISVFNINGGLYTQKASIRTGSSSAPIITNISVLAHETQFLKKNINSTWPRETRSTMEGMRTWFYNPEYKNNYTYPSKSIHMHNRLMDDGILVCNTKDFPIIIKELNLLYEGMGLGIEYDTLTIADEDKYLVYLDTEIYIHNGEIRLRTHYKKDKSEFYCNNASNHPSFELNNIIPSLLYRSILTNSTYSDYLMSRHIIIYRLLVSGFNINQIFNVIYSNKFSYINRYNYIKKTITMRADNKFKFYQYYITDTFQVTDAALNAYNIDFNPEYMSRVQVKIPYKWWEQYKRELKKKDSPFVRCAIIPFDKVYTNAWTNSLICSAYQDIYHKLGWNSNIEDIRVVYSNNLSIATQVRIQSNLYGQHIKNITKPDNLKNIKNKFLRRLVRGHYGKSINKVIRRKAEETAEDFSRSLDKESNRPRLLDKPLTLNDVGISVPDRPIMVIDRSVEHKENNNNDNNDNTIPDVASEDIDLLEE